VKQLAKTHIRVANIHKEALHQATTYLATLAPARSAGETKSVIVLEDLNVSGMLKNHHLAQAIADVGMSAFRRQLEYIGEWYGCKILIADRYFPSTKRCSKCGQVKPAMGLGEREYHCENCGLVIDRDLNAAVNLAQLI